MKLLNSIRKAITIGKGGRVPVVAGEPTPAPENLVEQAADKLKSVIIAERMAHNLRFVICPNTDIARSMQFLEKLPAKMKKEIAVGEYHFRKSSFLYGVDLCLAEAVSKLCREAGLNVSMRYAYYNCWSIEVTWYTQEDEIAYNRKKLLANGSSADISRDLKKAAAAGWSQSALLALFQLFQESQKAELFLAGHGALASP